MDDFTDLHIGPSFETKRRGKNFIMEEPVFLKSFNFEFKKNGIYYGLINCGEEESLQLYIFKQQCLQKER